MKLLNGNEQRAKSVVRDQPDLDKLCFRQVVAETPRIYVAVDRTDGDD